MFLKDEHNMWIWICLFCRCNGFYLSKKLACVFVKGLLDCQTAFTLFWHENLGKLTLILLFKQHKLDQYQHKLTLRVFSYKAGESVSVFWMFCSFCWLPSFSWHPESHNTRHNSFPPLLSDSLIQRLSFSYEIFWRWDGKMISCLFLKTVSMAFLPPLTHTGKVGERQHLLIVGFKVQIVAFTL